jgi:small conductance mechanosensitive channel
MEELLGGFNPSVAASNILSVSGQILLVVLLLILMNRILRQVVGPAIRRAVQVQMMEKSEIEAQKRAETVSAVVYHSLWIVILFVGLMVVLSSLGLNIAPVIAGVGIGGLALGLGAQSLVRDVIAGLLILSENQFGKGDIIQVGTISGVVEGLNLRRTVVRDLDGAVHSIPNGEIKIATNLTRDWSRVHFHVSVLFGANVGRACEIINRIGREVAEEPAYSPLIIDAPRAERVESMTDKGLAIKVLGVVAPGAQWSITSELLKRIEAAFAEERIEVAYPVASSLKPEPPKADLPKLDKGA